MFPYIFICFISFLYHVQKKMKEIRRSPNIVLIRLRCKRRCTCWVSSMKKFNISKYITSSSRRRSAIQNSIIWYAAKSGEKAAMGWKWFLGWTPRWGSIDEGAAVTDGMSRTDVDIIHYDWPTGFLYASSSSNKRRRFFLIHCIYRYIAISLYLNIGSILPITLKSIRWSLIVFIKTSELSINNM